MNNRIERLLELHKQYRDNQFPDVDHNSIADEMYKIWLEIKDVDLFNALKDKEFSYVHDVLMIACIGDWDSVNNVDTIKQYISEMMDKDVKVSHIVKALEENPSTEELYYIWLGNSMNTPTPINNIKDLFVSLDLDII